MHYIFTSLILIFLLCAGTAQATPLTEWATPALPTRVTLYPNSATVTVETTITPVLLPTGEYVLRISLPSIADSSSLNIQLKENGIASMRWEAIPHTIILPPKSSRIQRIEELQNTLILENAELESVQARISFWTAPRDKALTPGELEQVDALMARQLTTLHSKVAMQKEKITQLRYELAELQGQEGASQQNAALTGVTLVLNEDSTSALPIQYSYSLPSVCGWTTQYRLEALPQEKIVAFRQEARIWQGSGQDWKNIPLKIATLEPQRQLTPPNLPQWHLNFYDKQAHSGEYYEQSVPTPVAALSDVAAGSRNKFASKPAPVYTQFSTYAEWDLGKRILLNAMPIHATLITASWEADFSYTLRPAIDPQGFLTAKVKLPNSMYLPHGQALFILEGATLGERPFAMTSDTADIFFGSDPLVTAKMVTLSNLSGEQGFIGKERTHIWDWQITIKNEHPRAIQLIVEDPTPQIADKRIKLVQSSIPKPEEDTEKKILIWKLDLAAKNETVIKHTITLTAPTDGTLDTGRFF